MNLTIQCFYSCKACGLKEVAVDVPLREQEDVVVWIKATAELMGADHGRRNPACDERKIDIKIPVSAGTTKVGGPTVQ